MVDVSSVCVPPIQHCTTSQPGMPTGAPLPDMPMTCMQIAVGFGVSRPEHASQIVAMGAEGVICGSALVKALGESGTPVGARLGLAYRLGSRAAAGHATCTWRTVPGAQGASLCLAWPCHAFYALMLYVWQPHSQSGTLPTCPHASPHACTPRCLTYITNMMYCCVH